MARLSTSTELRGGMYLVVTVHDKEAQSSRWSIYKPTIKGYAGMNADELEHAASTRAMDNHLRSLSA